MTNSDNVISFIKSNKPDAGERPIYTRFNQALAAVVKEDSSGPKHQLLPWFQQALESMEIDDLTTIRNERVLDVALANHWLAEEVLNAMYWKQGFSSRYIVLSDAEKWQKEEEVYPTPFVCYKLGEGVFLQAQMRYFDDSISDEGALKAAVAYAQPEGRTLLTPQVVTNPALNAELRYLPTHLLQKAIATFVDVGTVYQRGVDIQNDTGESTVLHFSLPIDPHTVQLWSLYIGGEYIIVK